MFRTHFERTGQQVTGSIPEALASADPPLFTEAEFARRSVAVRDAMAEHKLAALVVYGNTVAHAEVQYLTGYRVTREAVLVVPLTGEPALYVEYFNHVPHARRTAAIPDVRWGGPESLAVVAGRDLAARGLSHGRIGLAGTMPWQAHARLRQEAPSAELVDMTTYLQLLRMVKSNEEIAYLRRGAALTDLAMDAVEQTARPGITEHDLITAIESAYVRYGGETHIHYLASTSMRNPDRCVPAQKPSGRRLEAGDVVITELSALYQGYPGQILRPFTIGVLPTDAYCRLFDIAEAVYRQLAEVIRPGATAEDVLDAASVIHDAGFTICDDLVHGFGGGYLQPVIRTRQTGGSRPPVFTFAENMTVVIQPNIITPDERMGLQVGELVRVTSTGAESLHTYPRRFTQCG